MSVVDTCFSVVVPVHNGERFLAECVETLRRQTRPPDEVIVVDDGSTDGTAAVASTLAGHVRYVRQANRGPGAARNRGVDLARGEFISILDVDDLWPAQRSELLLQTLEREPRLEAVWGRTQVFRDGCSEDGEPPVVTLTPPLAALYLGSGIYRRSVFDRVGRFYENLRFGEDTDWFLRAMELEVPMRIIAATALLYRVHAGNLTHDRGGSSRGFLHALRLSLARRRAAHGGEAPQLAPIPGAVPADEEAARAVRAAMPGWREQARRGKPGK